MKRLRLLLVDDHQVVRVGLRAILETEPDLHIVGEASNAAEALNAVASLQPDIVLLDIRLPDKSGISVCHDIHERWPRTQILILTSYADEDLVYGSIKAGATGYLLKGLGTEELIQAIRAVGRGDGALDPGIIKQIIAHVRESEQSKRFAAFRELSLREMEVLNLVAQGQTNAEIGQALGLSEKTVRNHVSLILSKLGLSNRIEAAVYAVKNHIEQVLKQQNTKP